MRVPAKVQFVQYLGIALAVHLVVLFGINHFNRVSTARNMIQRSPIDLQQYLEPVSSDTSLVEVDSPTKYEHAHK